MRAAVYCRISLDREAMGDDKPTGWDRLPDRERQADFRAVLTRVMVQPQQHRGQRTGDRLVAVWCTG